MLKWEKDIPRDFFCDRTHLWAVVSDDSGTEKVESIEIDSHIIHANIWGQEIWDEDRRGYYHEGYGLVSCHGSSTPALVKQLAKHFENAMYYFD